MTINLSVAIDTNLEDGTFDVYVSEGESGCQINFTDQPFSPKEHPEFDKLIGNEIYSWVSMGMEQDEEEKEEDDQ